MAKKLSDQSRSILSYRPNISFVEPEQQPGFIEPIEEPIQTEEVQDVRDKVKRLAKAVNQLAASIQAKADIKSKNMTIKLDPIVDASVVASMKRMYGHEKIDPYQITYAQYKKCKERLREKGEELGKRMIVSPEDLQKVKDSVTKPTSSFEGRAFKLEEVFGNDLAAEKIRQSIENKPPSAQLTGDQIDNLPFTQLGGFNTKEAKNGGLRPELQDKGIVIPPIDMEVLQAYLVRIFVNAIWEKFVYPLFSQLPVVGELMPEQLVEIPADGFSAQELVDLGVPVLGYPKPEQPNPDTSGGS